MISCAACGEPLYEVEINVFDRDGSDYWVTESVWSEGGWAEVGRVGLETTKSWTGEDLSLEEQRESVRCPYCKKYPFPNGEISTSRPLVVIFYLGDDSNA